MIHELPYTSEGSERIVHQAHGIASRATECAGEMGEVLPEELSAAGLMVPEPSVTPRPLVDCAEYMATARRDLNAVADSAMLRSRYGSVVANAFSAPAAPENFDGDGGSPGGGCLGDG